MWRYVVILMGSNKSESNDLLIGFLRGGIVDFAIREISEMKSLFLDYFLGIGGLFDDLIILI